MSVNNAKIYTLLRSWLRHVIHVGEKRQASSRNYRPGKWELWEYEIQDLCGPEICVRFQSIHKTKMLWTENRVSEVLKYHQEIWSRSSTFIVNLPVLRCVSESLYSFVTAQSLVDMKLNKDSFLASILGTCTVNRLV